MKILGSFIAVIASGLVLSACATNSSPVLTASALNQVSVGDNKARVMQILGNPTSASAKGAGVECLDYKLTRVGQSSYSTSERDHFITLKNGEVTCYGEWSCQAIFSTFKEDYQQCM